MRKHNLIKDTPTQKIYMFRNLYGASVIRNKKSYGHELGLWELAILKFKKDGTYDLCYDTEIAGNVIGYLTENDVNGILREISEL